MSLQARLKALERNPILTGGDHRHIEFFDTAEDTEPQARLCSLEQAGHPCVGPVLLCRGYIGVRYEDL